MKCRRCGCDTYGRICLDCLSNWVEMRKQAFAYAKKKYDESTPQRHIAIGKEMRRLDRLWRRDKQAFAQAITIQAAKEGE